MYDGRRRTTYKMVGETMNYFTVLTQIGLQKLANATAQNKSLKLTHMVVGDGNGVEITPDDTMSTLHNEVFRLPIAELKTHDTNSNWIEAAGYIPAQDGDFWVREVGLLDDQGNLIAMGNYPQTFKPTVENGVANDMHLKMILEISNTENISFLVDPAFEIANKEYVKESIANRKPAIETMTSNVMIHADDVSINNTQEVLAFDAITYTGQTTSDGFVTETGILEKGQTFWNDTGSVQTITVRNSNKIDTSTIEVLPEQQFIHTGVGSIDFTKVNNGTGFYHDRTEGDGVVKNDRGEVIESGNITLNEQYIIDINIKRTSQVSNWARFDGLRGVGQRLKTDLTDQELLEVDSLIQFQAMGVCFGEALNTQNSKFVSYVTVYTHIRWKDDFVEAYNPITGETIIIYKGDGVSGRVLSATNSLDYLQIKRLTGNNRWQVRTSSMSGDEYLELDSTNAIVTANPRFTQLVQGDLTLTSSIATNALNESYILYGKAKSQNWTMVNYTGMGSAGNFVETKDTNGIASKPRRIVIKRVDSSGDWLVFDTTDNTNTLNDFIYLNSSHAKVIDSSTVHLTNQSIGFDVNGNHDYLNASNGQYIALVEFETHDDGGSYFEKPLNQSKLQIDNGVFTYTNGVGDTGFLRESETFTGDIDFTGVSNGQKWIAKELDGSFKFYDRKPSFGLYEKENAQDNRVVFDLKKGKFFSTIGSDLIIDGRFNEGIYQWNSDSVALLTYENNSLKIDRNHSAGQTTPQAYTQLNCEKGVAYVVKFAVNENYSMDSSQSTHIRLDDMNTDQTLMNQAGYGVGEHQIEFVATHTQMRLGFGTTSNGSSQEQYSVINYVSVYKKEASFENILLKPISFLRTPILVINETPQLIEKQNGLKVNVMDSVEIQQEIETKEKIQFKVRPIGTLSSGFPIMQKIEYNYGSAYDIRTGIFTVPKEGVYEFYFYGMYPTTGQLDYVARIYCNENEIAYLNNVSGQSGSQYANALVRYEGVLQKGDKIKIQSNQNVSAAYSYFSGYKKD